jgi:hypothetical protein
MPTEPQSILDSTKKKLGLTADYDVFDLDIINHINTAFMSLSQLGIGPVEGFMIEDADTTWDAFLGNDPMLNPVKTYMFFKVKRAFDPPGTSFHLQALDDQIKEIEWRLNVYREELAISVPAVEMITPPAL